MIETIVLNYLGQKLSIHGYAEEPLSSTDDKYLVIERLSHGQVNLIDNASVAVQCYADSLYEAAYLCGQVESAMAEIIELDSVSRCELDSSYNFTDTDKKKYRYQAVFDLVYFEEEGEI